MVSLSSLNVQLYFVKLKSYTIWVVTVAEQSRQFHYRRVSTSFWRILE